MTMRDAPFSTDVWYHCFNLTIEKRPAFADDRDYRRFLEILYLANDTRPLRRNDLGSVPLEQVLRIPRDGQLVFVGAFCLMPDHFHIVLREAVPGGITTFMRKVGTAYTMYFNSRHRRAGNLFLKPFRSRQVADAQVERAVSYVHCTPAALFESGWKTSHIVDPQFLGERIAAYPYSSFKAHAGNLTALKAILDPEMLPKWRGIPAAQLLKDALAYEAAADVP